MDSFETATLAPMAESFEPMKKQKVEGRSIDREDKEGWFIYLQEPESEPEWDVDSFDGREYESDPEDRKLFSDEEDYNEYRLQKREFIESKGFVYEPLSGNYPVKDLDALLYDNKGTVRELCVKKFNEEKGKTVELVELVRVIVKGGGTRKPYITFVAREYTDGPLVEYHAKVVTYVGNSKPPFPILCRPNPKPSI